MSIASQLQALEGNIEDAYDMVAQRGGTMPQRKNMENLDDAIATIPSATTPGDGTLTIQKNGTTLGTFTANQSSNETIDIDAADSVTMLYVSDMGRNPNSVTLYKDEEQTEAASAQFIKDAFDNGKVVIYDDEYYFFAEIVAASEDGYPGTDVTFKIESGWETPSSGTDPEPEVRYIHYSSYASTTAEVSFVYLTQPFRGATNVYDGDKGYVPAPLIADRDKVLTGAGTWSKVGNDNIDWSTVPSTYTECTTTGAQKTPSSGNCKICKIGKIVNLQVNYNYSGTKVFDLARFGDVIIADIPAGYRPQFNIYGAAMVKCSSSTVGTDQFNQIHLWVNSTGALLINNMGEGALTGVAAIRGNLTWFVA